MLRLFAYFTQIVQPRSWGEPGNDVHHAQWLCYCCVLYPGYLPPLVPKHSCSTLKFQALATTDWHKLLDMKANLLQQFFQKPSTLFHTPAFSVLFVMLESLVHSTSGSPVICPINNNSVWCWRACHPHQQMSLLRAPYLRPLLFILQLHGLHQQCFMHCLQTLNSSFMLMIFCYTLQFGNLLISSLVNLMWTQLLNGFASLVSECS